MTSGADQSGRYVTLDGLRGVAALVVAAGHARPLFGYQHVDATLAVDFFFALSGFVIAHAYGERLAAGMPAWRFALRRLIRLYPLYAMGLMLGIAVWSLGLGTEELGPAPASAATAMALGAAMLPMLTGPMLFPFNGPAWSLFFELVANIAYGLCHRIAARPAVVIAGMILAAAALVWFVRRFGSADLGWQTDLAGFGGFARVGYSFLAGLLVYRLHRARPLALPLPPVVIGAVLAGLCLVPAGRFLAGYQILVILFVMPAVVYAGAGVAARGRQGLVFAELGAASYALYALHWPIAEMLERAAAGPAPMLARLAPLSGTIYLVAILALAWAAARLVDEPVRRRLMGWEARLSHRTGARTA